MTDIDNVVSMEERTVTLDDGSKVAIPRLTNKKVLQLVKYVAGDGMAMYNKFLNWQDENTERIPQYDENGNQKLDDNLKYVYEIKSPSVDDAMDKLIEIIPDEKLLKIISILVDIPEEKVEDMDFVDTAIIVGGFIDVTPIDKLVAVVKKAVAKFRPMSKEQMNQATQSNQQPQQTQQPTNSQAPYTTTPTE
ncbi:hypothetical protein [Tetragenococcus halophilus]|uniref:Uncharacterized protein n=1 Tax=Tetragenococcus halophilus (strain DSM 20338 / JCM 20259 / NCIMB 9735 / NBRC 12172) TaxID=945021 RepID=A0AAN1SGU4_TETHN|nr:hypothetical protein [Tetragenococcus halophilus]BAK94199.1 hypothetical protein TEH_08720 [Tetragenococcus halophilus NBRC 12172]GBD70752.1 putative uncharacterized protein [Tetragenococcus halophilus subsp. halophilus]